MAQLESGVMEELDPALWSRLLSELHPLLLNHLPFASQCRFRTVSKSWNRHGAIAKSSNAERMSAAWWRILSMTNDAYMEAGFSLVCREWRSHCRRLPCFKLPIPEQRSVSEAEAIIAAALRHRRDVRSLALYYAGVIGPRQSSLFELFGGVSAGVETIDFYLSYDCEIWRHLSTFPRLVDLRLTAGELGGPRDFVFRRLTVLKLSFVFGVYAEAILKACPLLERLKMFRCGYTSPCRMELESQRMVMLSVSLIPDEFLDELVIRMANLKRLTVYDVGRVEGFELGKLKALRATKLRSCCVSTAELERLEFRDNNIWMEWKTVVGLISQSYNTLKMLRIACFFDRLGVAVGLKRVLPPSVEVLLIESNLVKVLEGDGGFQGGDLLETLDKLYLPEEELLPRFSLRYGAIVLNATAAEDVGLEFVSAVVEMVRCSPRLRRLAIVCEWPRGSCLEVDAALVQLQSGSGNAILASWEDFVEPQALHHRADCVLGFRHLVDD